MGRYVVHARGSSMAGAGAVWRVLADVSSWKDWGPYSQTYLEREGDETPTGVGAVRVYVVAGLAKSRERVTRFEPERALGYTILSGFPARDYQALVTLSPNAGGGTLIRWRAEFDGRPRGTGSLVRSALVPYLAFLARASGRAAERSITSLA